jgi:hypothetical protein
MAEFREAVIVQTTDSSIDDMKMRYSIINILLEDENVVMEVLTIA